MTITQQFADDLISLPKRVVEHDLPVMRKTLDLNEPIDTRIQMMSSVEEEFSFFLEISQSPRARLKLTFHFQEKESSIGLLRIDYGGGHKNPEAIINTVPATFKPYAGLLLRESHIHYFVEGYAPLKWAIPLKIDPFPIKDFTGQETASILQSFAEKINLQTRIEMQAQLL